MRRRIIICLGLLLALCLIGDAIALICLDLSISQFRDLAESHRIQSMRAALNSSSLRVERDSLADLLGEKGGAERRRESIWRFKDSLRECNTCHHRPAVQGRLDRVQQSFEAWLDASEAFYDQGPGAVTTGEEVHSLLKAVVDQTTAMVDQAHTKLKIKSNDVSASAHNAWVILCITLVAALAFGGAVAFHLQQRLTRPVEDLLQGIERLSRGDEEFEFLIDADQEFRQLGDAFNKAYRELKSARAGVIQAEKMAALGKLAAGVAHEVGNPLASISSIAQIMRRRCSSEEEAEQVDLIMKHVARISSIVREMLSFSRPSKDEVRERVDVTALLEKAIRFLGFDKRSKNFDVIYEHDPDLKPVKANGDRMTEVFTNIILNAFDALSEVSDRKGVLRIRALNQGEWVAILFEDNGSGMSKEEIAKAFEPFFTTKPPGSGTGLGLWLCYETINKHGGTIQIDSTPNKGTKVAVRLPCQND